MVGVSSEVSDVVVVSISVVLGADVEAASEVVLDTLKVTSLPSLPSLPPSTSPASRPPSTSPLLMTDTSEKKKESTESQLMDGLSGTCGSWGKWDTFVTVVVECDFGQSAVRKYVVCLVCLAAHGLVLSGLILSMFVLRLVSVFLWWAIARVGLINGWWWCCTGIVRSR